MKQKREEANKIATATFATVPLGISLLNLFCNPGGSSLFLNLFRKPCNLIKRSRVLQDGETDKSLSDFSHLLTSDLVSS